MLPAPLFLLLLHYCIIGVAEQCEAIISSTKVATLSGCRLRKFQSHVTARLFAVVPP